MSHVVLTSIHTCPGCGFAEPECMPTNACLLFYECRSCKTLFRPKTEDCCVTFSFGKVKCLSVQERKRCFGWPAMPISGLRMRCAPTGNRLELLARPLCQARATSMITRRFDPTGSSAERARCQHSCRAGDEIERGHELILSGLNLAGAGVTDGHRMQTASRLIGPLENR